MLKLEKSHIVAITGVVDPRFSSYSPQNPLSGMGQKQTAGIKGFMIKHHWCRFKYAEFFYKFSIGGTEYHIVTVYKHKTTVQSSEAPSCTKRSDISVGEPKITKLCYCLSEGYRAAHCRERSRGDALLPSEIWAATRRPS